MGSTRQIFSEDRHRAQRSGALQHKIHLIIKYFWPDRIKIRKYLDNREISKTASINQKKHWKIRTSDENLEDICVLFFLQLFLISLQRSLSVVAFKTKTFFFHLLKSWKKFLIFDSFFKESKFLQLNLVKLSCPLHQERWTYKLPSYLFISQV